MSSIFSCPRGSSIADEVTGGGGGGAGGVSAVLGKSREVPGKCRGSQGKPGEVTAHSRGARCLASVFLRLCPDSSVRKFFSSPRDIDFNNILTSFTFSLLLSSFSRANLIL